MWNAYEFLDVTEFIFNFIFTLCWRLENIWEREGELELNKSTNSTDTVVWIVAYDQTWKLKRNCSCVSKKEKSNVPILVENKHRIMRTRSSHKMKHFGK